MGRADISVDRAHVDPVALAGVRRRLESAGEADAVLLTPAHQFPLSEFRYDRHPVGSFQAHAPEHVVYAGTASKTLAPGLRLAWLVVPPALVEPLAAAKRLA